MPFAAFQIRDASLGVSDTWQSSQNDDQGPVVRHVLLQGRSEVGERRPVGEQEMWVTLSELTPPSANKGMSPRYSGSHIQHHPRPLLSAHGKAMTARTVNSTRNPIHARSST